MVQPPMDWDLGEGEGSKGEMTPPDPKAVKEEGDSESVLVDVETPEDLPPMKLEADDAFHQVQARPQAHPEVSQELKAWLRHFRSQILAPILRNTKSGPFRKPVDAVALGIFPVYYQVIKKPMDLGTVRQNIDNGAYGSKEECISDLMLVWNNAMTFNNQDHIIHKVAAELKEQCQNRLDKLEREGIPPPQTPKPIPTIQPKRDSSIRRDARKKSFDLPGEISTPQHLEQKYVSKLSSSLKACDSILKNLLSLKLHRDYVEPFIHVERKTESDAYQPMSLSKIQQRMRSLQYSHPMEFADDMRRIVTETYRYCHPDDPIVAAAAKLQQEFEMLFAKINFQENELLPPILTAGDFRESDDYVSKLLSAQNFMVRIQTDLTELIKDYMKMKKNKNKKKQMQMQLQTLAGLQVTPGVVRPQLGQLVERPKSATPSQPPPAKKPKYETPSPALANSRPFLTLQEANELKEEISQLDSHHQFKILEILQANDERLVPDANGEVEIEIVKCSAKSVVDVKAFLARIKTQRKPIPVSRGPDNSNGQLDKHLEDDSSDSDSSVEDDSSSEESSESSDESDEN